MTDRRVDFTETESEDSDNDENVNPARNSHASSGLKTSRNTKKCDQDYYRCRFARTKGFNCKAKLKVIFDAKSEAVTVWKTSAEHTKSVALVKSVSIKKELCKHILLVKYEKEEFRWPEEFAALPLNTKFTGRPRKRQLVTRYQGN
ncbi:hypothetical protein DdX_17655 [Ditylenchus destructor]|uniref:Uncharacterized protein n=1 Tax=Ditylenchus destructor TaxID=166010 RepID=A0AAD4MLA3_9BILA|nr:hypothetical protein DdX_17655 [Ditylenchus destructor]